MKKWLFLLSIITVTLLSIFLYQLKPEDDLNHQANVDQKLVIWAYSPALIELANDYQKAHDNIEVVTKQVENPQTLLEELYVAESAGTPPHIAEIPSFYGIYPFIQSDSITNVEKYIPTEDLVSSIKRRFTYDDKLWAIPIGYHIPLLYLNDNLLPQNQLNDDLTSLFQTANHVSQTNHVWGLQSDTLYPWYIANLLKNEGLAPTELAESSWGKARNEYHLLPRYTYHFAITQFANSNGGILLSTSQNLLLLEKLIGSKFKWSASKLPISEQNLIPNGSGLVVFKHPTASEKMVEAFLAYVLEDHNLQSLAIKETFIPPYHHLINDPTYLNEYRQYPGYQEAILKSLEAEGEEITPEDEDVWKVIIHLDEKINENR